MKQSKKGKQWYFGMKAHVVVDAKSKLIHHVVATSGAVPDGKILPQSLHDKETKLWGDTAYAGKTEVIEQHASSRSCSERVKELRPIGGTPIGAACASELPLLLIWAAKLSSRWAYICRPSFRLR